MAIDRVDGRFARNAALSHVIPRNTEQSRHGVATRQGGVMIELGVLFNLRCVVCSEGGTALCSSCQRSAVAHPIRIELAGVPVIALGGYDAELRAIIRAAKFRGAHALVDCFAHLLEPIGSLFGDAIAVPIPSSREGYVTRGFHVSRRIARLTGLRIAPAIVLDDRASQHRQSRSGRFVGRTARVTMTRLEPGRRVVLVDDVITTGATIRAAIEACRLAGIVVVGVIALAVTPQTGSSSKRLPKSEPQG